MERMVTLIAKNREAGKNIDDLRSSGGVPAV